MAGIGTIVNVMAIIAGGLCGLVTRRFLEERYQETIMKATGFAIIVMALGSTLSQMLVVKIVEAGDELTGSLDTQGTIMMILSLVLGALLGEWINLDRWFERFGAWLRDRSGNQEDRRFIDGFVSASLTVCVGAMAVIGSLEDGIRQDPQMLYAEGDPGSYHHYDHDGFPGQRLHFLGSVGRGISRGPSRCWQEGSPLF